MSTDDIAGRWNRYDVDDPYECRTCGTSYDLQHYVCPECGGFSVERRTPYAEGA